MANDSPQRGDIGMIATVLAVHLSAVLIILAGHLGIALILLTSERSSPEMVQELCGEDGCKGLGVGYE